MNLINGGVHFVLLRVVLWIVVVFQQPPELAQTGRRAFNLHPLPSGTDRYWACCRARESNAEARSVIAAALVVAAVSARTVVAWQQAELSDPLSARRRSATSSLRERLLIQPQYGTEPQRRNERLLHQTCRCLADQVRFRAGSATGRADP